MTFGGQTTRFRHYTTHTQTSAASMFRREYSLFSKTTSQQPARRLSERILDPKSIDVLASRLELDLKTNNFAGATSRVERRLKEEPTPTILLLAARTYIAAKDSPAAERVLRQAIELDASLLPPYELLGRSAIAQRKLNEARIEFEALARRRAKPVSALTMTGMILMAQGQTELAKKRFEEVLAIDPRAVIAANNLAWMLAESGDNLDTALKYAQVATAQAPDQPELMDTLGWVYYKKNLPELAIPLFENCVKKAQATPRTTITSAWLI